MKGPDKGEDSAAWFDLADVLADRKMSAYDALNLVNHYLGLVIAGGSQHPPLSESAKMRAVRAKFHVEMAVRELIPTVLGERI